MTRSEIEAALKPAEDSLNLGTFARDYKWFVSLISQDTAEAALRALLRAMPVIEASREQGAWQDRFDHCSDMTDWGDCECQEFLQEARRTTCEAIREHDKENA